MSLIDLPQELLRIICEFADRDSTINLRSTSKYLLNFIIIYSKVETINFQKDYSQFEIKEAILDFSENRSKENLSDFIDSNVLGKIDSIIVKMDECSIATFEFIDYLFETSANLLKRLKLELKFSTISYKGPSNFFGKFVNLNSLSLILTDISDYNLSLLFEEFENVELQKLKNFELCIRSSHFSCVQFKKLEKIIQQFKPNLEKLILEIWFMDPNLKYTAKMSDFIQSLENIPIIDLKLWRFNVDLIPAIISLSDKCKEFTLRMERFYQYGDIDFGNAINLTRLDGHTFPDNVILNSSLRELRLSYSLINFDNNYDNLKRLELDNVKILLRYSNSMFPSLEYAYCENCDFTFNGIEFFSQSTKLKNLILRLCDLGFIEKTEFHCRELEELDIITSNARNFDISSLRGLNLKRLSVYPNLLNDNQIDFSAIEQMSSLEYLNLGEYHENISFSELKRLNYLEFEQITILEKNQKVGKLLCENLLRNCVIAFDIIRIEKQCMPFPILSESGIIEGSLFELIALKLNELGIGVAGVKFALVSEKLIYVSFYRQSKNKYSYPSFILFESEFPNTILEHKRSQEKKEKDFDFESSIEYLLELKNYSPDTERKCEIQ